MKHSTRPPTNHGSGSFLLGFGFADSLSVNDISAINWGGGGGGGGGWGGGAGGGGGGGGLVLHAKFRVWVRAALKQPLAHPHYRGHSDDEGDLFPLEKIHKYSPKEL
uniref:Uncharacterized protein n=1 Tax=Knipowitschia caucasica TaxID=637954 RepID=A0AAV2IXR0_KNICA